MQQILPTNACFDDALELIAERVKETPTLAFGRALILVHGIARGLEDGPRPDEPYAHAWVEEGDQCWDAGLLDGQRIYYAVSREEFYAARRIQTTTRYTVRQAALENLRTGHFGPWVAEYRALCGGDGKLFGTIQATVEPGAVPEAPAAPTVGDAVAGKDE